MTTSRSTLIAVLSIGIALGACAREAMRAAVIAEAHAENTPPTQISAKRYVVVGDSRTTGGYEEDLNAWTAHGWNFVGPLKGRGAGDGSFMVFERSDGKWEDRP